MPVIVKPHGMRVAVFSSNEHPPAHVHVMAADWAMSIRIDDEIPFVFQVKHGSPNGKQKAAALSLVREHLDACRRVWREIHG